MIRTASIGLSIVLATAQTACDDHTSPTTPTPPIPKAEPTSAPQGAPDADAAQLDDADITSAVQRQLRRGRTVMADDIQVKTKQGIVMLTGTAPNLISKERAVRLASVIRGVRAVNDRIGVVIEERPDEEIRDAVKSALHDDPVTEAFDIDIEVAKQEVTLSGKVESWQEKLAAERVAKATSGVKKVNSDIEVDYAFDRPDVEIASDVRDRLRWDALVDDGLIVVAVEDGAVTLTGTVGSLAEKERAHRDAWVTGSLSVDNEGLVVDSTKDDDKRRGSKYALKSSLEMEQAVKDALALEPRVRSDDLTPKVSAGVVTLTGTVSSIAAKYAAESVAEHTVGVTGVENDIVVTPKIALSAATLKMRIEQALLRNPITEAYEVEVAADPMGVVTLTGDVDSHAERAEVEHVAGTIVGVTEIKNLLDVEDPVAFVQEPYVYPYYPYVSSWTSFRPLHTDQSDAEIRDDINDELLWSPFVDEEQVTVSVKGGVATLTGTVNIWHERESAENNAFEGGALKVDNQLEVR